MVSFFGQLASLFYILHFTRPGVPPVGGEEVEVEVHGQLVISDASLSLPVAVTACMAIANIVKSSLGPVGLDKMLVRSPAHFEFVPGWHGGWMLHLAPASSSFHALGGDIDMLFESAHR